MTGTSFFRHGVSFASWLVLTDIASGYGCHPVAETSWYLTGLSQACTSWE